MRLRDRLDRSKRKPSTRRQRIGFAFFFLVVAAYAYVIPQDASWNVESHLYLTFSVVDHHSLNIDPYHTRLGDMAYYHGHYYSDKAPGLSFLAVPVYAGLRLLDPRLKGLGYIAQSHQRYSIPHDTVSIKYVITYVLLIVPSAILALLLWLFLTDVLGSEVWALALAAVYALGTVAYIFSTKYFSHQVCAILLFSAFLTLYWRVRGRTPDRSALKFAVLAGLLAGYAGISEYPTFVIAGLLGAYTLLVARDRARAGLAYAAGMAPPALLAVIYNLLVFGKPIATGYAYERVGAYRLHIQSGLLGRLNPASYGVRPPSLYSLWQITFGTYRGIFLVSPVLLLFFAGLVYLWKRRDLRPEFWLCLSVVVLSFLVDASRDVTQSGWSGGWSVTSRHLTPMLPFMVVPIALGLRERAFKLVFVALGAASVAMMVMIVYAVGLFTFADQNPLAHEVFPNFFGGKILITWGSLLGLTGFRSLLPLALIELGLLGRIVWLFRSQPHQVAAPEALTVTLETT